ncbi:hypothetical protein SOJ12_01510, partial [Treponema pallidum subsp. pallidum]
MEQDRSGVAVIVQARVDSTRLPG